MDIKKIEQEFEEMGVNEVRRLFRGNIWREEKQRFAEAWLNEKDHGEERTFRREQLEIAREAKDAAWEAARAAKKANTRATIALIIASISVITTIISLILPHVWKS